MRASFNTDDICISEGWATYHKRLTWRQRWCRHRRARMTEPANDYCPQAYLRCPSCGVAGKWFNVGTHRFGGVTVTDVEAM